AQIDQVCEINDTDLTANDVQVDFPVVIVQGIPGHGGQSLIIAKAVATQRLKPVNEEARTGRLSRTVNGLSLQHQQSSVSRESLTTDFGLARDERLEWREIVQQPLEAAREQA